MSSKQIQNLLIILKILIIITVLILILGILFFISRKREKWESLISTSFECGFSSYYFSRFSFSIHYFLVGLIFLFLDLELSFILPFFRESLGNILIEMSIFFFIFILLTGLIIEWKEGKLEWNF